ncbi:PQQ-dependent sugar dehydrogenase [Caldovatus aquaticus]|uniref:PQQ-dependent sugar dehydrogenase n=1 Tax=Caldovatus aquaticus TaxID=2865671 RepID=A0ABS7EY91_9PROT|nr:PQQ-dependent sugar dehydrogenase [Caldovatus aquaticus]MBW8268323.1 PQQ-dependent sugar dehydrogenase [Caldovatus aquaticus]
MPRRLARIAALAVLLAAGGTCAQVPPPAGVVRSEAADFRVEVFAAGLERPWGGAFLPDGRLLVTERPGRLRLIGTNGRVSAPLAGTPAVETGGQGGLLDIALAPDFPDSRALFLCHAARVEGGALTRLTRARLSEDATALEAVRTVLDATPAQARGRNHFGCRMAFSPDGGRYLFLSTGDRYVEMGRAQRLDDLAGKVLRLTRNGRVPPDNPFAGRGDARGEIWSYGHRNPQGLAFQPGTGLLWASEFGPRGGDELNIIRRGANYGWPLVTHGVNYDGSVISERRSEPGMEDPVRVWTPVISPSGIAFYDGAAFPSWRGNLFVAALNRPALVRLTIQDGRVTGEERLLPGLARLRQVLVGPEGFLYLLTDEPAGRVLRLRPA